MAAIAMAILSPLSGMHRYAAMPYGHVWPGYGNPRALAKPQRPLWAFVQATPTPSGPSIHMVQHR